ncbi:MAG: thioredoxin [Prevotella sp.]|jgi:thioredoxin 1|nr:thioredoxin [Prevotella sp.]
MKTGTLFPFLSIALSGMFIPAGVDVSAETKDKPKEKSPVVTLSALNYGSETSKGLVLVDFWAAWCRPCRRLAPILDEIAVEYRGSVKICKVNVDNYKKFSIDKGVQALPTIIVYRAGKEVDRVTGQAGKDKLVKVIESYAAKDD